ncbi:protein ROH1-like [Zingiber officinale]|uniref:Uncharacterized protein n=1 Tax=Zingiber officinale TaxID=94328 RepID=A0A8J5F6L5_ZINOF|nr:protein ROH1-like [Zingiber officinale]XP_042435233.1 protein ROH1-like [Zingiber officinale]KAG6479963.1 hypothetical protein ZIOFF_063440 [Zingiber officinale]
MPAQDRRDFPCAASVLFPSLPNLRRDQVHAIDDHMDQHALLLRLHGCVAEYLRDLSVADADGFLSLSWVCKLLHGFLICHEEFRAVLFDRVPLVVRPPLDRFIADFSDRAVKALDICNAARDGIDHLRRCRAHVEIVVAALSPASSSRQRLGEGQVRRARKALGELEVMLDDKDCGHPYRNRSFGYSAGAGSFFSSNSNRRILQLRSISSSASRSWSASRQLQAMGSNVVAPRDHEIDSTAGLAVPIYTMSAVLLFAMRSLVAALRCQDRGALQAQIFIPRAFPWAAPIMSLHQRVAEESKKKEHRRNSTGLLKELRQIHSCTHNLISTIDNIQFPMSEEEEKELRQGALELSRVCEVLKQGLDTLERQIMEIFLRIGRSRTEALDLSSRSLR